MFRLTDTDRNRLGSAATAVLALILLAGTVNVVVADVAGASSGHDAADRWSNGSDEPDSDDGDDGGSSDDPSGSDDPDDEADDGDSGDDESGGDDDSGDEESGDDESGDDESGGDDETGDDDNSGSGSDDDDSGSDDDDSGSGGDDDDSGSNSGSDDDDSGSGGDDDDSGSNSGSDDDESDASGDDDNSGSDSGSDDDDSGSGSGDDNSGSNSGSEDDNSGSGSDDDSSGSSSGSDDDNSGSGSNSGSDDDNSGSGSNSGSDDDNSGSGSNSGSDDDNSGSGRGDDNSGSNSGSDDDNSGSNSGSDDDNSGSGSGEPSEDNSGHGSGDSSDQSAAAADGGRSADVVEVSDPADILQPTEMDADRSGYSYRRNEIVAIDLDPVDVEMARELGFVVETAIPVDSLGGSIHILRAPEGSNADESISRLQGAAPRGAFSLNHIYLTPQSGRSPSGPAITRRAASCSCRIGMLDTGVAAPALRGVKVRQRAFGGPAVRPNTHGTAVASLMFGREDGRSELFVADVFAGAGSSSGAASSIVRGLDWLASTGVTVINISLAGPPNPVVQRAIAKLTAKGVIVVAAAGNDGPAAPPSYPAAYSGVIAVTAVDSANVVYRYAGRGDHIDYAALGVNVNAARPQGGVAPVSGTSFASPIVAARIAHAYGREDPATARRVVIEVTSAARDLGAPGRDRVFGNGLVSDGE